MIGDEEGAILNSKYLQWKPLNAIILGQRKSDIINQLITINNSKFLIVGHWGLCQSGSN